MSTTHTVYNGSPHPLGFASGKITVNLVIGETRGVSEADLLAQFRKPKSALVDEVMRGTLRLDGFYPSQVLIPRKPPGARGNIDVALDPDRPRLPKTEIKPLYSTSAPCPKMLALVERARNPHRVQREETFAIEVPEPEAPDIQAWLAAKGISEADLLRELAKKGSPADELIHVEAPVEPGPAYVVASVEPEPTHVVVSVEPSEEMTVAEIQAWLDTREIPYSKSARKADLLALALATVQE